MPILSTIIRDGTTIGGIAGLLYAATISTAALVALLAPSPTQRRDAIRVLQTLLRRHTR